MRRSQGPHRRERHEVEGGPGLLVPILAALLPLAALAAYESWQHLRLTGGAPAPSGGVVWQVGLLSAAALAMALFLGVRAATVGKQGWERSTFLRSLLDSAPIAVAVVGGPEYRLDVANPLFRQAIAQAGPRVAGATVREALPEPVARAVESHIAEVRRSGRTGTVREVPLEAGPPPHATYWDVQYIPLAAIDRQARPVLVLATPVTDKVHARQEVRALATRAQERANQLQAVLSAISESVWLFDARGHVQFVNEATARSLGIEPTPEALERLSGMADKLEVYWPDGTPVKGPERHVARALRGESFVGEEFLFRLPGGRGLRWARASAGPLRDEQGRISGAVFTATDITREKEAQAERERLLEQVQTLATEAERRAAELDAILRAVSDSVIGFDLQGHVNYVNEATARFLGLEPTPETLETLTRTAEDIESYWPDGRRIPREEWPCTRALRGETVVGRELLYRLPGQRGLRWVRVSAAPVRDEQGRITGAVNTGTDVTPQKRAQAEREHLLATVQAGRENLQTILASLPDAVVVLDPGMRVILSNDAIRRFLGRDVVGLTLADLDREFALLTADGRPIPQPERPTQRVLRGEPAVGMEVSIHLPDGRQVALLVSAAPLRGPEPGVRVEGVVVTATDITPLREAQAERERLLAEVEAARENLRAIVDRLPEGVLVIDRSRRVTLDNETIRRHLAHPVAGMSARDLWAEVQLAKPDREPFAEGETPFERALQGQVVTGAEVTMCLPGGKCVDLLDSVAPLYGPDGTVREVATVLSDVTALKEVDRAKDQFFSVAAHELRTPLTSLRGHAEILLRRAESADWSRRDRQSLQTIDEQVDRLNDLIGRLLDVSRIRLGRLQIHRQPTDIVALARKAAQDLQVTTERHRMSVEADPPELVGDWDPAALRQVLTNLIGNAIKYAPGGPIDVRIHRYDAEAWVSVSDRGPGIPPERQARLFEAFSRGTAEEYREAGGLGLGLYISRGIVQAHGGRIWLESEPGVGSTFTFALPILDREGDGGPPEAD